MSGNRSGRVIETLIPTLAFMWLRSIRSILIDFGWFHRRKCRFQRRFPILESQFKSERISYSEFLFKMGGSRHFCIRVASPVAEIRLDEKAMKNTLYQHVKHQLAELTAWNWQIFLISDRPEQSISKLSSSWGTLTCWDQILKALDDLKKIWLSGSHFLPVFGFFSTEAWFWSPIWTSSTQMPLPRIVFRHAGACPETQEQVDKVEDCVRPMAGRDKLKRTLHIYIVM